MVSIRKGTFLENSKLKCEQIIDILYYWAKEDLAKGISQECRLANVAVTDWRNFCRDICAEYYVAQNIKLGGPNRTVEIDESAFVRRKYNVGHRVKTQWVFGALERDTRCVLVAVEDRSADTLLEIIQEHILPGTTILRKVIGTNSTPISMCLKHYKYHIYF
uniref:ISXO2-like transposase domain-containing protein n=1 Tax=Octopus bimaculoides TaxID=37653 RepID=A0A0L8H4U4_OCTBM